jgi:AraC-like DNA-binding protein
MQVIGPTSPVTVRFEPHCEMLVTLIERDAIVRHATPLFTGDGDRELDLDKPRVMTAPQRVLLRQWLDFLFGESMRPDTALRARGLRQAEQTLIGLMLLGGVETPGGRHQALGATPYYLKRAEEFIDASLDQDIGIGDIVQSTGVSARTLYYGFRKHRGMGIMAWVKLRRLERVHQALIGADPGATTVTEAATHWGFFHLGKFAAAYRRHFGELPSRTLRRE